MSSVREAMGNLERQSQDVDIRVYPPDQQASGGFDQGRITEIKPIGFSGEGSAVQRVGPLFYWGWAHSTGYGKIGLHPHRGFEIVSYVLEGEIGHRDTLGMVSRVATGGAQVMQTASGVSHEEEFLGTPTAMFQIWFEPDLRETVTHPPTYREVGDRVFPVFKEDGVTGKTILGNGSPVSLVADVSMQDVTLEPGRDYQRKIPKGRSLAVVAIKGEGSWQTLGQGLPIHAKDFSVIHAKEDVTIAAKAGPHTPLRLAIIEVPQTVGYPLYQKS